MKFHWTLPRSGIVKINVHGATPFIPFFNDNLHGVGMIIRNNEGELLKLFNGVSPVVSAQ